MNAVERPAVAKGRRPYFFDDPSVDKLLSIIMALASEASVLKQRLETHELLAEKGLWATPANIESMEISDDIRQAREQSRAEFLKRVLRVLSDELQRMKRDSTDDEPYPAPEDLEQP